MRCLLVRPEVVKKKSLRSALPKLGYYAERSGDGL